MNEITRQVNEISPIPISTLGFAGEQVHIDIRDACLQGKTWFPILSSTIFRHGPVCDIFVVISLSGSIIREAGRRFLQVADDALFLYRIFIDKAFTFILVCLDQFGLMLLIRVFVHLFGLDSLNLGTSPCPDPAGSFCCRVGYRLWNCDRKHSQHIPPVFRLWAISVVIMAAIGGIWIPTFIMSEPCVR